MIYKRGGTYWYKFMFAGQHIRESAKTRSVSVARDAERARRRQLGQGYNSISKSEQALGFTAAGKRWLGRRRLHVAPSTAEIYELALSHLGKVFGGRPVSCISATYVTDYQSARLDEGAAARTVNMEIAVLRGIMGRRACAGLGDELQAIGGRPFLKERRDTGRALTVVQRSTPVVRNRPASTVGF